MYDELNIPKIKFFFFTQTFHKKHYKNFMDFKDFFYSFFDFGSSSN